MLPIFIQTVVKNSAKELKTLYYFLISSIEVSKVHSDTYFWSTKEHSSSRLYVWFFLLLFISYFIKMGEYPYSWCCDSFPPWPKLFLGEWKDTNEAANKVHFLLK